MDIAFDKHDGLPRVIWIQMLPKTTQGARLRWQAIFGGMAPGALLGFLANGIEGVLFGAFLGGGLGGILFKKSMQDQGQQEWARRPVLVPSQGQAFVSQGDDERLMFSWFFQTPDGGRLGDTVPLTSFDGFQLGSLNEWFAGPDDRNKFGDCMAIVLHAGEYGTKCVAAHAGSKAEMAQLHAALTGQFVVNRASLAPPPENAPQRAMGAPRYSDDIPKSL